MKKAIAVLLTGAMLSAALVGCSGGNKAETKTDTEASTSAETTGEEAGDSEAEATDGAEAAEPSGNPVELDVTTTFAGEDSNAGNFRDGVKAWEDATGNTVNDASATSDEAFKARIAADFEMGAEPDVLFYFTGADANSFIEAEKVVSLEEIRAEYPDYASNMDDEKLVTSLVDDKLYTVSTNGYWEAMFVNTEVLEACGLEVPGADYTWEQFMADCEVIKENGYSPIAASLGQIPHYWWEFSIFNNDTDLENHDVIPATIEDAGAWVSGMEDIKALYEAGYFPENTLSATDDETFQLFMESKAAFLLDGSWKAGGIAGACSADPEDETTLDTEKLEKFTVTYVPAKGARKASDLIGGYSMGYYITRKAWDDPDKRAAAVSFVQSMTTDEMIFKFAVIGANPLKDAPEVDTSGLNSLQVKALDMVAGATSWTPAAQDLFQGECRVPTFDGMPQIVTGEVAPEDAVAEGISLYLEAQE